MASLAQPRVVILGLDSITGLQSARLFAARGIGVVGVAAKAGHPACRTRVCERIEIGPLADRALIDRLLLLAASFPVPPVLLPCTDLSVLALSQHRLSLAGRYRMVLPRPGVIEMLLDKSAFQSYAQERELPVARSLTLRTPDEAERASRSLAFPVVLKPAVKTPSWQAHTAAKVYRADTPQALLDHYHRCRHWTDTLVVQEWIDGPDTSHVTCNAYFDGESRAHLSYVSQKIRQWPHEGGVGCFSRAVINDEVREVTARVFHAVSHRGLAYLEMKRDPRSGRYLIIEPNVGRPTGRSAAADHAGVELLYSHYCDALDQPLPPGREQPLRSAPWIYLRQDVQSAVRHWRNGDLSAADWVRSLRACRRDAVFSWSDPRPFVADLRAGVRKTQRRHTPAPAAARDIDFDIHGVVGLRLLNASAGDAAIVTRQLGPFARPLSRRPDITIRFVERLEVGPLRWVEVGRSGFSADGFYVVQCGKRPAAVRFPLDQLGEGMEIQCQKGARSIPHLIALVTMVALEHGCVPLHASAFSYHGVGALVCGWAKGGKTEALLAFARQGAEYIGDEWILLTPDGRMAGIPEHIRLQDWHLAQLPAVQRRIPRRTRAFFSGVRALERAHRTLSRSPLHRLWPAGAIDDALPPLRRQLNVQVNPSTVFERHGAFSSRFDLLFLMVSHTGADVSMTASSADAIGARMNASVEFERVPLLSAWLAHRFAFPSRTNDLFDRCQHVQRAGLSRLLSGKPAYEVRHPYPCHLQMLFDAMAPAFAVPPEPSDLKTAVFPASQEVTL
jgi:D-aspartate ligase